MLELTTSQTTILEQYDAYLAAKLGENELQSFSKPAGTPVVLNHNSIYTSFFKQYFSPPPPQSMLVSEFE
jgi:hypothetical protein